MDFRQFVKRVVSHETVRPTYLMVPPDHVDVKFDTTPLEPDKTYFEIRLREMFLAHDRKLYKTRHPTLHAFAHFLSEGEYSEAVYIAGPQELQGLAVDLHRIVSRNYRLLGPIAYRGEEIEVLLGLLAIESDDFAASFLNLLSAVSNVAGLGYVASGIALANPLKESVDTLLNLKQTELCIGLYDRLVPKASEQSVSRLIPGYRFVATVPQGSIKPDVLWIRDGQLLVGPTSDESLPPQGYDYFLFTLEKLEWRDDWSSLPNLSPRLKAFNSKLASPTCSEEDIRMEFELFKGAVLASSDLIHTDRVRIIRGIKQRAKEAMELRSEGLEEIKFLGKEPGSVESFGLLGNLSEVAREMSNAEAQAISTADLINTHL